jgi:hypothetical protein
MPIRGQRLVEPVLLTVSFLGLLTTWSLATARYGGPDEPAHVLRAAAVAQGDLLGSPVPGLVDGFRSVRVPAALATGDPRCFRHDKRMPATCAVADADVTGLRSAATSSGTYPPWYFAMVGLPVRLLGDVSSVVWYRLVAASWCAIVLGVALVRARRAVPILVLASLTPAVWFLCGVVNPNALEVALLLLAWVGVERLRNTMDATISVPRISDMWWIGAPAALAIAIRPIAAVAVGTVIVTILILCHGARRLDRRRLVALTLGPALAVVADLAWSTWSSLTVSDSRAASSLGVLGRFDEAVSGVTDTMRELSGSLGWLEFSAPWPAQLLWWSLVLVTAVAVCVRGGAVLRAWSMIAASVVVVPVAFETLLAGRIGFIWQGRYSIPTALGLVIVGSGELREALGKRWCRRSLAAALALVEIVTFWSVLRRYAVGSDGSWLLADARWHPQVSPLLLICVNAVLVGWITISSNALHQLPGDLVLDSERSIESARDRQDDLAERGRTAARG